jgi:hypothetical protein
MYFANHPMIKKGLFPNFKPGKWHIFIIYITSNDEKYYFQTPSSLFSNHENATFSLPIYK